jgi:tripartite-type tricarboxylate transporter receptor subunit TctC
MTERFTLTRRDALIGAAAAAGASFAAPLLSPAQAEDVADFYRGRQVILIVGYGPGGGYDVYARIMTRHLGKHIPGQPNVILQNMPGAGSLRAVNFLYNVAPKDGTTIATFSRDMPLLGILGGNTSVNFDAKKFTWLGSSSSYENDAYMMFVNREAAAKSLEDARRPGGPPIILAGTGEGATGNDVSTILRDALGINLKVVAGYPDSGAIFLAADRHEVDGRCVGLSAVKSSHPQWLEKGSKMHIFLQFARVTRHPDFPNVPTARELAKDESSRALVELAETPYRLSRPFAAPPGLPADRAAALQAAFMAVHKDPEYLAEAEKLQIDVSPIDGVEVLKTIEHIAQAPPDRLAYMRKLLSETKNGG